MHGLTFRSWSRRLRDSEQVRALGATALLVTASVVLLGAPVLAHEAGLVGGLLTAAAGVAMAVAGGLAVRRGRRTSTPVRALRGVQGRPSFPVDAGGAEGVTAAALTAVLSACHDLVVLVDTGGRVVYANDAFVAQLGEGRGQGGLLTDARVLAPWGTSGSEFRFAVERLLARVDERGAGELNHPERGPGAYTWVSEPWYGAAGVAIGRSFVFHDRSRDRELAALKSDFLSTVTHELRTPLTSVKGSLQLVLGKSAALSSIDRELLGISLKNADRLIRMINDLLDISRLELGKLDLIFTTVATGAMVEEAVAGLRAYASGRDIAIGCELDASLPALRGDRDRLIQVLTNLLSNAVKFSPAGGRVLVRAWSTGRELAVSVRDWGVGIRADDQARLFQRFQRLNPGSSTEPGAGLGLAISKAIIDRHGGRIVVESREEEGSTFTLVLPVEAREGAVGDSQDDGESDAAGTRPTLLLVDDDADLGKVLEVSLGATFRMLRVERGVQALDVARAERPALILLDVVLPDLSGYDVLRILQHSEATGDIPIVMLTVQPERELASGLGASEVVAKPVDIEALRGVIERILGERAVPEAAARAAMIGR